MLRIPDQDGQGLQRKLAGPELQNFIVDGAPSALRADALMVRPVTEPTAGRDGLADETLRGLTGTLTTLNNTLREMNRRMMPMRPPHSGA